MAGYCTGVTVNWRGTAIGEVTEYRIGAGGSLPMSRGSTVAGFSPWAMDMGTVELASVATNTAATASLSLCSLNQYGTKGELSFSAAGITLTTKAICQTLDITAKVNDVYRVKAAFRIVKE
jgi:hypothetical protein